MKIFVISDAERNCVSVKFSTPFNHAPDRFAFVKSASCTFAPDNHALDRFAFVKSASSAFDKLAPDIFNPDKLNLLILSMEIFVISDAERNCVSVKFSTPFNHAPDRFAFVKSASCTFAPYKFAPDRFAFVKSASSAFASDNHAPDRFAFAKIAPDRFALEKYASDRIAFVKFENA